MPIRSSHLWLLLLCLVLAGCDRFGGGEEAAPGDTTAVAEADVDAPTGPPVLPPDSAGAEAPLEAPEPDSSSSSPDSVAVAAVDPNETQDVSMRDLVSLLITNQEAMNGRLDSLSASLAPSADSAAATPQSGEVLGEARQQVRSFGVRIVWSIVVIALFNIVIRLLVWLLDTLAERNASRRLFYKRLVPIVRIVLWIFAAYLVVRVIFRLDAQGILAAAAAIGVAVALAAQDLLKNLFGGLILVFDQPFQVGDKVRVGGTYGEVVSIGLRSTRIVTPDDSLVSVPNARMVDEHVANANAGELNCQVVTDLYLPGWSDEVAAQRIAFEAAASSKYVYLNKPIVTLVSDEFKETFLTRVRVKAYVLDPRLEFLFQSDVTERARQGFREAGLLRPEHMRMRLFERTALGVASSGNDGTD